MSKRVVALAVASLAIIVIAGGCGGGGDATATTATATISKAQFIKQADAICVRGNEQLQSELATYLKEKNITLNENQTPAESTAFIEIMVPNLEKQVGDIRSLGTPSGDEEQVEAILSAIEAGAEKAEADPEGTVQGEVDLFGEEGELAKAYGFKACALA